jgi:YVTN family beta-propeller protein
MIQLIQAVRGIVLVLTLVILPIATHAQPFVNYEAKQTAPIRLSPDGSRLFAVNTPDGRLSVFNVTNPKNPILIAEIPVGLEPVSVNPVNNDEAWVVNEVSDSVSIVSVSQHAVINTLHVKDEPADVVFANGRAFVSCSRNNQIAVFDQVSHAPITNIPVLGESPRSLCVNSNGTRVYAAFALSGNRTTLIPFDKAPPPPAPTNPNLPPPPQVSLIVDATDPAWTSGPNAVVKFNMPDNDIVEIDTATLALTRYFPRVGTVNFAIAIRPGSNPGSGDLYVANTDARNTTRFEPVIRGGFVTNQISRVNITSGAVTRYDLNPGFAYTNFPNLANQSNALAQPTAIAFGPSGGNYYITAFGSDRVAQINSDSGGVVARIELNPSAPGSAANPRTKRGPRGLALKPGTALYVLNRISNTITVVDPFNSTVVREIPVGSHDPTPQVIREGRGFLYDAKLSGGGLVSCASCHIDGEMDMLAWDLGNPGGNLETNRIKVAGSQTGPGFPNGIFSNVVFHPMKGPMTTQTLRGLAGLDPLHWRGDRTNFMHFNGAFDGLLGGGLLSDADMALYRNFINTMVFQPNPNQTLSRGLPATFEGGDPAAGRNTFVNTTYATLGGIIQLRCNTCHALPRGTDNGFTPALALQEPQDFKVPHLRNVYQKMRFTNAPGAQSVLGFGIVHDGMDPSLESFLSRPVFGPFATDTTIKRNLNAFVQCLDTGTAPAVGLNYAARSNSAGGLSLNGWAFLEGEAQKMTNIELVVKAMIGSEQRGYLYRAPSNDYRADSTNLPALTKAQLVSLVQTSGSVFVMGVPPGSGTRAAIDRNLNGILDGDEPRPTLTLSRASTNLVIAWPTNTPFVLETASALPAANWNTETSVRGIVGSSLNITNATTNTAQFYRLKEL